MNASKSSEQIEAEGEKRRLLHLALGRFVFEFSQLEFMIRHALAAALDLRDDQFYVITSTYDFAALCNVTKAYFTRFCGCSDEEGQQIEGLLNACLTINQKRVRIAHGTWFIDEEESGATHVSRNSLEPRVYYSRPDEIDADTDEVMRLKTGIMRFLIGPVPPK